MSSFDDDLQRLSHSNYVKDNPFKALACVADYFNNGKSNEGRELLYHVMDHNVLPHNYDPILTTLQESAGIYPYIQTSNLTSTSDLIAYEAHRPIGTSDIVLHSGQFDAYNRLMDGENVVLSAPTSFGKSLLIDILIMSGKYHNIVVIVPTIALIDETRKRLQDRFRLQTYYIKESG